MCMSYLKKVRYQKLTDGQYKMIFVFTSTIVSLCEKCRREGVVMTVSSHFQHLKKDIYGEVRIVRVLVEVNKGVETAVSMVNDFSNMGFQRHHHVLR
ncbi:hypothetical protein DPMN_074669 [Dreissena polymorpha]|uniref:Uncharacterized protein n=1 Tax=Dreissena polymorpha TaxID=45954 RepID=A0A9D4BKV4_DREPO|nr:hypothetical protein DPMN_074669 [Dreissena polymorpha]